ncbi:MAG: TIR domain-containing protein [Candidatus Marithrix sp.]
MTSQFKDLFISYGRRESLGFVGRLHQQLKLAGYDGWFDKVNIPDGDDYAQRINYGIESAHNFVYVMAPRCMTSPYCLIELEYARLLGKKIIPINQMVLFETSSQELSDSDKQVLVDFYQFYNLSNQNIQTTQDVLNRSHTLIGCTDWLDAKERVSTEDCQHLLDWAQPYENNWAKHDDLDYLQSFEFPIFGEIIDTLDGVVERIATVLNRQTDYIYKHTKILADALWWQKNQKATQYLLVSKKRAIAEEWLLTEFLPPKQPPCLPSVLVCEFICEARKNAENLLTDVFICYGVEDKSIRNTVINSLSRYAITTWIHDRDIQKGYDYACAIEQGIENADNFFYFISPNSVISEYCQLELKHAFKYNKRIIPLLIAPTPETDIPEILRSLQYVDFTDNISQSDYDSDIDDILNIFHHDQEYYEQHKILLVRSLKWQTENYKPSFLLRGHNLDNAKTWLRLNDKLVKNPPLALHKELIIASEAAKGQLGTEVFISYSRKDADFARQLNTTLQEAGKTTWFDQESISTGVDFENEIFKGINSADNFLFIISPDAIQSEYCEHEVNYANEQNKRFISILYREINPATMPQALRVINWIDFKDTAFDKSFPELIQAIELDREHTHQHTVLQQRASDWLEQNRSKDFLLNMTACKNSEIWLDTAINGDKQPAPTELQQNLIKDSRNEIQKSHRRRNALLTTAVGGMIIAIILAFYAISESHNAKQHQRRAEKSAISALSATADAKFNLGAHFESLLIGLTATQKIKQAPTNRFEPAITNKVAASLQQSLYWIKERYRINMEEMQAFFSPNKKLIATPAKNDTIELWDFTGNLQATLKDKAGLRTSWGIKFYANGKIISIKTKDEKRVKLWQPNGTLIVTLEDEKGIRLHSVELSPDESMIAIMTRQDDLVKVWQLDDRSSIKLSDETGFEAFCFGHDSQTIITQNKDYQIKLWQIDGTLITTLNHNDNKEFKQVICSSRSSILATLSKKDKQVQLWDLQGNLLTTLPDETGITSMRFNPKNLNHNLANDKEVLATLNKNDIVKLWNSNGELINTIDDEKGLTSVNFSPKGQIVITSTKDNRYKLWQLDGSLIIETKNRPNFFSYDEHIIATTTEDDKTVQLWQQNGEPIITLKGHQSSVETVAFNTEKTVVATGSWDNTIKLWQLDSGTLITTLTGHGVVISNLQFSVDGETLVSTSYDKTTRVWQLNNELRQTFYSDKTTFYDEEDEKQHRKFIKKFVTATKNGQVKLWDNDGEPIKTLIENSQGQIQAKFGHKGHFFLTYFEEENEYFTPLKLWHDSNLITTLIDEKIKLVEKYFLADDQFLITVLKDNNSYGPVQLWNTKTGKLVKTIINKTNSKDGSVNIYVSEKGKTLVTEITDKNIYGPVQIWDMNGISKALIEPIEYDDNEQIRGNIIISENGKTLVTIVKDKLFYGPVKLWNDNGEFIQTLIDKTHKDENDWVYVNIKFNDKSQTVISKIRREDFYGPVKLWQINGKFISTLVEKFETNQHLWGYENFSSDGKMLVTAIENNQVKLWHSNGKFITTLLAKIDDNPDAVFSNDSKMVVASYENGPVVLWQANKLTTILDNGSGESISFSPNDKTLVLKWSKKIKLLDIETNKLSEPLEHLGNIWQARFSPDNKLFATSSYDKTIKLWERNGTFLSTLSGHTATVNSVYFSENSEKLLTADENGEVIQWQLKDMNDLNNLQKKACQWVKQYLKSSHVKKEHRNLCIANTD